MEKPEQYTSDQAFTPESDVILVKPAEDDGREVTIESEQLKLTKSIGIITLGTGYKK